MIHSEQIVISSLQKQHDRSNFFCGEESLDKYIKQQANQDIKRRISRIFVANSQQQPDQILGYYSLSSLSIELSTLPMELAKKLPRQAVPCALIGRLAVNKQSQGNGLGKLLLVDAIKRTLSVSQNIAVYAMIVDSINDQSSIFYKKFGFSSLNTDSHRLYLQLQTIA